MITQTEQRRFVFVPLGTSENSPALQCWEMVERNSQSPARDDRSKRSVVPSGTSMVKLFRIPALKCWAILGRPWRDSKTE